jgi:hypothetical protein
MREFILFDADGKPMRVLTPRGEYPAQSTIDGWGGTSVKPRSECTKQEYEDAIRATRDQRNLAAPARRRWGGHGFRGGDGFIPIR